MSLEPPGGTYLGAYETGSPIRAGEMGEVIAHGMHGSTVAGFEVRLLPCRSA